MRANPTFTLVNIAIAVTEGIGKQLDPEVDLMAAALPFFARFDFFRPGGRASRPLRAALLALPCLAVRLRSALFFRSESANH